MRCPLILVGRTWGEEEKGKEGDRCLKEECAWWDEKIQMCAVRSFTARIRAIEMTTERIEEKITKEGEA